MPRVSGSPERAVNRRPKDRKAQIARASADAFSALGYHAVGMEDIAAAVGISATALYRHSSSKYVLFRDAVMSLGQQLVDCTAFADDVPDDGDPTALLDESVAALINTAIANRSSGGLYRWEGRYLHADDQAELMSQMSVVNRRLQRPLNTLRPTLSSRDRWTLSSATLSVIGSIADHRAKLPTPEIRTVLSGLAAATLAAELPAGVSVPPGAPATHPALPDTGRYEALLRTSMRLFNKQGYRETSMEDIAAEVGMPASGIYRYFAGKGDLLAASYRRAADRVSGDLADILAAEHDPARALAALIASYVARSFDDPELAYVYYTEGGNLPPGDQVTLRGIQRSTVDAWVRVLVAVRPEFTSAQARFAVHAGFALVVDLGRLAHYANTEESQACVRRMVEVALLGAHATVLPAG